MAVRELPAHPSLEQYKKQAKEFLKACKSGDPESLRRMKEHPRPDKASDSVLPTAKATLADARSSRAHTISSRGISSRRTLKISRTGIHRSPASKPRWMPS